MKGKSAIAYSKYVVNGFYDWLKGKIEVPRDVRNSKGP